MKKVNPQTQGFAGEPLLPCVPFLNTAYQTIKANNQICIFGVRVRQTKNKMKKVIVFGLIALLVELTNNVVYGQNYSGGSGTQTNPYLISSKADMEALATAVNGGNNYAGKYFLLTQDLTGENDSVSTVIGSYVRDVRHSSFIDRPFNGTFDGGKHEIAVNINTSPIVIDENTNTYPYLYIGLFGYTFGTIKNLGISGYVNVAGYEETTQWVEIRIGGICGYGGYSNTITDCYNKADITASGYSTSYAVVGGIAGVGNVYNSYNSGNVSSYITISSIHLGGIAGDGNANKCYNTGDVYLSGNSVVDPNSTGAVNMAGGILGYAYYGLEDCYNTGNVTVIANGGGDACVGGIAGAGNEDIIYCYNIGKIKGKASNGNCNTGGIVGYFYQISSASTSQLKNNFCACDSIIGECLNESSQATVYKIAWWEMNSELKNNYSLSSTITYRNNADFNDAIENNIDGANGKAIDIAYFKNEDWLSGTLGFDFNSTWKLSDINSINQGFPIFNFRDDSNPPDNPPDNPSTDVESIKTIYIKVYPNPANQYLYINSDSSIKKIDIYNSVGNLVLSETNVNEKIDVSILNAGLYIVKVYTNDKVISQKFIIKN